MPRLRYPPPSPGAAALALALRGRRSGRNNWMAKCPGHADNTPSLSISASRDGKPLFFCHAGCSQDQVLAALKDLGLWDTAERSRAQIVEPFDRDDAGRKESALAIWNASIPATNTLAETYLRSRGITLPVPATLRFHAVLKHHPSDTTWPAMVALIVDVDGTPVAVHRTYLTHDGTGKAEISTQKMTLGSCRGGAIRLGEIQSGKSLAIAEGIETTLSVAQACQLPAWAALSADGLKTIALPPAAKSVILAADHDVNGVGQAAAEAARKRLVREGRKVRIVMPPQVGTDFNDLLLTKEEDGHVTG
jgi:putative DNA primase/helicase